MDLKDPKIQKILLSCVFAVGLLYVYFVYDYAPKAREMNLQAAHLEGLNQHIMNAKARIERSDEEKLRRELRSLEKELDKLKELFPLEEEVPFLLSEVERRGLQSGVHSVLFEPRGINLSDLYSEHRYRVSVRSGYHNIGLFLSLIARMDRIISAADLKLFLNKRREGQNRGGEGDQALDVVAEFDMSTYTTTTVSSEPPDSTGGGG